MLLSIRQPGPRLAASSRDLARLEDSVLYENYGPFPMPVDEHGNLRIGDRDLSKAFFRCTDETAPGLAKACGCYVFAMRSARATTPWYVGKADKTAFGTECFNDRNMRTYFNHTRDRKGSPFLFLIARMTPTGRFAKPYPSGTADVDFVESYLIGVALRRNPDLLNVKKTRLYRDLKVPGCINANEPPFSPSTEALRQTLGL